MIQPNQALCGEKKEVLGAKPSLTLSDELLQKETLHTLGENAAAVLHELRGPLQAIRAHVQLLEKKAALPENVGIARHFPPIYEGIDHINALLDQFLRLSRLTAAQIVQLDIGVCLQEILPLLRSMAIMRDIELTTDFEPGLPTCAGDEQQLKRLVFNLFANACDAIAVRQKQQEQQKQQGQIWLLLKRDRAAITLTVCDNGCGIGADKLSWIWQPFFTDKVSGTGLGLPNCLAIATELGGTLTADSHLGEGSCFKLCLPVSKPGSK